MRVRIAVCLHLFGRQLVFKILDIYHIQFNYLNVQQQQKSHSESVLFVYVNAK